VATLTEVTVPDIGDFTDVPVIEILVEPGQSIQAEDPLVTLESDKATMDVPAPDSGVVEEVLVSVGDTVSEGTPIAKLAPAADQASPSEAGSPGTVEDAVEAEEESEPGDEPPEPEKESVTETRSEKDEPDREPTAPPEPSGNGGGPVYASPSVRRLAREIGVDLASVEGSGRKGRIVPEDVQKAKDGAGAPQEAGAPAASDGAGADLGLAPWPKVDFEKFGPVERQPLSRIKKISGPVLHRNWVMIPHVTQNDEADITDLEAFRKATNEAHAQEGVKVTMVALLVKACVATLKAFPDFNASLDGDDLVVKQYWNIGFAADTPQGLLVPVIKQADQKGILDVARELTELSGKAREGKLAPGDMNGATFTISSLGGIGGTGFTPIINAPELAILGVSRSATRPVWNGAEFVPRLMLPLSLSYDHRVIDGAAAARFTAHLAGVLSDLKRALL
jgi:pyruvate dehydrogenase E2 component (dihydrolipoamide acetyltransferase)